MLIFDFDEQEDISPPGNSGSSPEGTPRSHSQPIYTPLDSGPSVPGAAPSPACPFCEEELSSELLPGSKEAPSPERFYPRFSLTGAALGTIVRGLFHSQVLHGLRFGFLDLQHIFPTDFHDKALGKRPFFPAWGTEKAA